MDNTVDVPLKPASSRTKLIAAVVLMAIVGVAAFALLRPGLNRGLPNPVSEGPPAGSAAVAEGMLDGVPWKQFAWAASGGAICIQFAAGASSTSCETWKDDGSPFVLVDGDSPISDGERGALTTVIQGVLDSPVTSLRVVEPAGAHVVGVLTRCRCAAGNVHLNAFTLPLTRQQTAVDADGRYVTIAAFDGTTEVGRVRVPVINFGYCGREDCR